MTDRRDPEPASNQPPKLSRRQLLQVAGLSGAAATAGVGLSRVAAASAPAGPTTPQPGETVVRTVCSPNCTGACGLNAFIRDGRIVRIQQASDYPDPAYNPRGCMKGLSFIQSMYGPDRIKTPLIRAGARGEGKWREATWDEVLDYIASRVAEVVKRDGAKSVYFFPQLPGTGPIQKGSATRLAALLEASHGTFYDFNGDLPLAAPITFGVQCSDHESKDWSDAKYLLLVGANPVETRIPDAHFLFDATDNGAKMVVIDPVFSPTAAKADQWISLRPGTDAALGLGMAHVIVKEKLADLDFMTKYSDAPLLVRDDTGKRLRASELREGANGNFFVLWDTTAGKPVEVPNDRLGVPDGARPALQGRYQLTLKDGRGITAKPGFQHLVDALEQYSPDAASKIADVPADTIVKLAHGFATTKPAAIIFGAGTNHWYHSDLSGRAFALVSALTGNIGRSGGGFSVYVGQYKVRFDVSSWWFPGGKRPAFIPPMYLIHGPTETMSPDIKLPPNGFKAILISHGNMFTQAPHLNRLLERIDKMDLVTVMDFQMTPTAEYADVVLPAATWYEKYDLIATPLHPYLQLMQPAIPPQGEARTELWFNQQLAQRLEKLLDKPGLAQQMAFSEEDAIRMILKDGGPEVAGITLEQLKQGPVRLKVHNPDVTFYDQIHDFKPFPSRTYPLPLAATQRFVKTGRMEFYKEEDRFLQLGEQVPTYKPPFEADSQEARHKFPLVLLSPHSRWRVHSTFSNQPWLLEINGGKPQVELHPDDASQRGIKDGDAVELFNDRGRTTLWAHVTERTRPGTAVLYQGWWKRYFKAGKGVNELTSDHINPIDEIYFAPNVWSPVTPYKEVLTDVRKVKA